MKTFQGKLTEQEFFSPYTQGFSGIYPGQLCHFVIISRAGEYREKDILPPQCRGTWGDEGIVVGIVVEGSHRLGSLRDTSNDATSKIGRAELETGLRRLEPSSSFAAVSYTRGSPSSSCSSHKSYGLLKSCCHCAALSPADQEGLFEFGK